MMPVFLVGALGVFIRGEFGFSEVELGVAVAGFMASSALFSVLGGRLAERFGAGKALTLVALGGGGVMLLLAALASSWIHIVLLLMFGGMWNGLAQPAGNLALARARLSRPALVFGIKQAAIPIATLLAGMSVPLIGLTVGWRWAFALGAMASLALSVLMPRHLMGVRTNRSVGVSKSDASTGSLVVLAIAVGVGSAAAVSLGTFLVEGLVADGMQPGAAGWLLVAGSVMAIGTRLLAGWLADRRRGRALRLASLLLALGSIGYASLGLGGPIPAIAGTLLAFGGGWAWTGLVFFAVVRLSPNSPGAASGIISAGGAGGAAVGPLIFGYIIAIASPRTAWNVAAGAALTSSGLVAVASFFLFQDRRKPEVEN